MSRVFGQRARLAGSAAVLALAGVLAALTTASATTLSRVYYHGSRTAPVIALTFDDGWSASNCAKIERILQANGATATFFPNARWVRQAPAFWKQLAAHYPFGDHTANHPHMRGLSYASQYDEINSDRLIVERITGVPLIRVFRAPYGEWDSTTLAAAAAAGFPITADWDVNVYDVTSASDAELLAQATAGRNGSIITAHCGPDATVRILPEVIAYYRSHGFRFATIPQLLAGVVPAPAATSAAPTGAPALSPEPSLEPATSASPEPTVSVPPAAAPISPRGSGRITADVARSLLSSLVILIGGAAIMLLVVIPRPGHGGPRDPAQGPRA